MLDEKTENLTVPPDMAWALGPMPDDPDPLDTRDEYQLTSTAELRTRLITLHPALVPPTTWTPNFTTW